MSALLTADMRTDLSAPPTQTQTLYEAGIDTARLLYRLHKPGQQDGARAMFERPGKLGLGTTTAGWIDGHELLWVEGRAAPVLGQDDGLLGGDRLPDVQQRVTGHLRDLGFTDAREVGIGRLDVAVGVKFDRPAEGWAVLRGMLALDVPRRKTSAYWDRRGRPQTVYAVTESGKPRERTYDKGAELGTAAAGTTLRFEAQQRFTKRDRTTAGWWTMERVREGFQTRFEPMAKAADGLHVAAEAGLRETVRQLVGDGRMTSTQAERVLGHVAAESVGIPRHERTVRRRRAELRRLGLAMALDGAEDVDVDLGAILADAMTTDRWTSG